MSICLKMWLDMKVVELKAQFLNRTWGGIDGRA